MDYWILATNAPEGGLIDAYPRGGPDGYLWDEGNPLLAELPVPDLEILPVAIRNHRDEIVATDHAFWLSSL